MKLIPYHVVDFKSFNILSTCFLWFKFSDHFNGVTLFYSSSSHQNTCFLEKNVRYFFSYTYCRMKFFYSGMINCRWNCFCVILRIISHNDLKCDSIVFHKQRKQLAKYESLSIAPVRLNYTGCSLEFLNVLFYFTV